MSYNLTPNGSLSTSTLTLQDRVEGTPPGYNKAFPVSAQASVLWTGNICTLHKNYIHFILFSIMCIWMPRKLFTSNPTNPFLTRLITPKTMGQLAVLKTTCMSKRLWSIYSIEGQKADVIVQENCFYFHAKILIWWKFSNHSSHQSVCMESAIKLIQNDSPPIADMLFGLYVYSEVEAQFILENAGTRSMLYSPTYVSSQCHYSSPFPTTLNSLGDTNWWQFLSSRELGNYTCAWSWPRRPKCLRKKQLRGS